MAQPPRPTVNLHSVDERDFTSEIHLTMLRQLITGVENVNEELHDLNGTIINLVERIARIEGNDVAARLTKLEGRIDTDLQTRIAALEVVHQQSVGAQNMMAWLKDYTPWLVVIIVGAVAWYFKK